MKLRTSVALALSFCALLAGAVRADEAEIRKNLAERYPSLPPIDEIRAAPVPGLFELRLGTDIVYTDGKGAYLIQGEIIDTASRRNLTEDRIAKLTAVDFASLPLKDAIVWKNGKGTRKIVVFADPNCGYCKKLEKDLVNVKDVTVYTFVIPILGGDSPEKSRDIWCAKDNTTAWRSWMIEGVRAPKAMGAGCDVAAIDRNSAMARKFKVNGTPAIVFEDGTRAPGAIPAAEVERRIVAAAKS